MEISFLFQSGNLGFLLLKIEGLIEEMLLYLSKIKCLFFFQPFFKFAKTRSLTSKDDIIKRIIALEGDYVVPRNKMLQQKWRSDAHLPLGGEVVEELVSYLPVQVPKGHVWIEGDNAPQSRDSNSYGTVILFKTLFLNYNFSSTFLQKIPLALLVGTASFIFWPISRIGFIPKVDTKDRVIPREVTLDKETIKIN